MIFQQHKTDGEKRIRRLKYGLARKLGFGILWSIRIRDWTDKHYIQIIEANCKHKKSK